MEQDYTTMLPPGLGHLDGMEWTQWCFVVEREGNPPGFGVLSEMGPYWNRGPIVLCRAAVALRPGGSIVTTLSPDMKPATWASLRPQCLHHGLQPDSATIPMQRMAWVCETNLRVLMCHPCRIPVSRSSLSGLP